MLWRVIEWHLGRHLTAEQVAFTLGDLHEDLASRQRVVGRMRAAWWLARESISVAAAYRSVAQRDRRFSKRTIMGTSWMDDARFAMRRLIKRPGASLASVLTLACAIGAGATTWSLLSSLLLHPLPVESPDQLVTVGMRFAARGGFPGRASQSHLYPLYLAVRESGVFEGIAAGASRPLLVGNPGDAALQPRNVYFASHDYFDTLGVPVQRGRDFTELDDRRGAPLTAIVSDRFWRTVLNADSNVVGRTLVVWKARATIIGVAPRGFRGLNLAEAPDVYVPLHTIRDVGNAFNAFAESPTSFSNPSGYISPSSWIAITGRLRAGTTAAQAVTWLDAVSMVPSAGGTFELTAAETAAIPEAARTGMIHFTRLLTATVGLLLLIGCLTVGTLLLVRTEARRDEFAMCLALGGSRFSLARGIVLEGALISTAGLLCSVPVASWLFSSARAFELPGGVAIELLGLSIDRQTWLAAAVCAGAAMLAIAVVAGTFGFSSDVADVLRSRAGATPRVTRRRTRATLVVAQVAVALVLVAGAGLLVRSLRAVLTVNPGFDASRIVMGGVSLDRYGYTPERATPFFDELRERLVRSPAIASASLVQSFGAMSPEGRITVDGVSRQFASMVSYIAVDERYFSTIGLPIVAGRDFTARDTVRSPLVVIVSQSFGRVLAADGEPVGHRITEVVKNDKDQPFAVAEVVGVVPDVITDVNATEPLLVYYSLAQKRASPNRGLFVKARSAPGDAVREVLAAVKQMNPAVEAAPLLTIGERLGRQMGPQRLGGFVLGALGSIAILLTVLGAYVLAESMASMRQREFGIRAALGASRLTLGGLVLAETGRLVGAGLLAGLGLAWMGASTIRTFLFRVEPLDLVTLSAVAGGILALALLVSLRPALDSARVDLAVVLREE